MLNCLVLEAVLLCINFDFHVFRFERLNFALGDLALVSEKSGSYFGTSKMLAFVQVNHSFRAVMVVHKD